MKILFTSVGRRVELIQEFRNVANNNGKELLIYGADISETAPALYFCDKKIIICRIDNPDYINQLLKVCREEKIDVIIPTIDTELPILAENKEKFLNEGIRIIISNFTVIEICQNKFSTQKFFGVCDLVTPITFDNADDDNILYPCIIKPTCGSSSVNVFVAKNKEDLKSFTKLIDEYIIQSFIKGVEYTIDVLCDLYGNPIYITPRIRLATRSGEVLKTKIHKDKEIVDEIKTICDRLKPCGPITVQLIKEEITGKNHYIEINPRFGGGAPLSMKAGADSANALVKILYGKNLEYTEVQTKDNIMYSRFDQSICINSENDKDIHRIKAVIFDLDDTLYSEKEYVKSGYRAVSTFLNVGEEAFDILWNAFENKRLAIDELLNKLGIYSDKLKEECLNVYRNHDPEIHLHDNFKEIMIELKNKGIKIGVITDGRPISQSKKIKALGIEKIIDELIVTDSLGGEKYRKPNEIAFKMMQSKFNIPFSNIIYIGDNIKKDFIAPEKLGMQYMFVNAKEGLYNVF